MSQTCWGYISKTIINLNMKRKGYIYISHKGKVHCIRTITLHLLILELLPFVIVHIVRLSQTCWGYISKTITDWNMKLQGYINLVEEKFTAQEP